MKRLMVRFAALAVITLTGCFLYLDSPAIAAMDCATAVYNKWNTCDNSYSNTAGQYAIRQAYCVQNAPAECPAAAEPSCAALPSSEYANCCLASSRSACEATISANYENRGSSYFSCMGFEGNFGNCIEQVADFCLEAQGRVSTCNSIYEGLDNSEARSTCIANSGINQCV